MMYISTAIIYFMSFFLLIIIYISILRIKKNIERVGSFERKILWKLPSIYSYIYGVCPTITKKLLSCIKDKRTEEELLILLENISANLSGGTSIVDTIRTLIPRIQAPLKNELNLFILFQKEHGTTTALSKSMERADNVFLKIMWNILLTYYKNGGAVSDNIRRLHNSLYTRLNIKSKLSAQLMQTKVQIIAGVALPYLLFTVMWSLYPELMAQVPGSKIGLGIISFAILLHTVGIIFFIRITRFDTSDELNTAMLLDYICFSIKNGNPVLNSINNIKGFGIVEPELLEAVNRSKSSAELIENLKSAIKPSNIDLACILRRGHELGTHISDELAFRSKDIMEKLEHKALRFQQLVPVKAMVPMLFCIFPATYLMILVPIIVEISNSQI